MIAAATCAFTPSRSAMEPSSALHVLEAQFRYRDGRSRRADADVLEWLGHRDFATTLIYSDYAPSEHEREWVEAAFTRGRLVHPGVPGRTAGSPPTDDESQT
jgi:hypothetical protein